MVVGAEKEIVQVEILLVVVEIVLVKLEGWV